MKLETKLLKRWNEWWSRGHNLQGQGREKNPSPQPRTDFSRTDPLKAKDRNGKDQGPRTQFF